MPDLVFISDLTNAGALGGTERVPMDKGNNTVDASTQEIANLATKTTVGLANCNNTSDLAKPVSTATQTALDLKANSSGTLAQFAATTSAQLLGVISDETGTGSLVFATSPTLVAPALGTPVSGTLTNCTGLPAAGVTGLGTLATQSGTFSGTSSGTNTGDQTITLTGDVTGSGTGSFAATVGNAAVIGKVLTSFTSGAGTVAATDTILQAIQKLDGNDAAKLPITFTAGTITYGATVDLDLAALAGGYRTISLTGALTFTTSNRASGRQVTLRLICDSTARALTFPAGWVFVGTKPSTIAASKTAVLSLTFFGAADADCVAAYGVQT